MSMFTLAISCLTTSNLPWFMDLTFQVPILLLTTSDLAPITSSSTTGYCFCFGSIPSFFLELFLHWSPVAYWAPTNLRSSFFSILLLQEGVPLPGPETGLLPNTRKWIVRGDTCADKARDFIGKGTRVESRRVREPRRTALPHGSQSWVLWWWD